MSSLSSTLKTDSLSAWRIPVQKSCGSRSKAPERDFSPHYVIEEAFVVTTKDLNKCVTGAEGVVHFHRDVAR
ncbi:hypothetical protein BHE74_00026343 [Ensete ventricosum]|nr:hypothetical protein GW17_00005385 [Ensete ventricosum]RWW66302.1 hypothetical protein BHE74_00026343 [Ensete ventricosum]RZR96271.1 hypothetical protein BHM03_00025251 [Ensete ventricosum]